MSRNRLATAWQSFGDRPKIVWRPSTELSTNAERLASLDAQANELGGSWQKDEESLANRNTIFAPWKVHILCKYAPWKVHILHKIQVFSQQKRIPLRCRYRHIGKFVLRHP